MTNEFMQLERAEYEKLVADLAHAKKKIIWLNEELEREKHRTKSCKLNKREKEIGRLKSELAYMRVARDTWRENFNHVNKQLKDLLKEKESTNV